MSQFSDFFDKIGRAIRRIIDQIRGKDDDDVPSLDNFADPRKPFLGYGLVDDWFDRDPAAFLDALVEAKVDLAMFEATHWLAPGNPYSDYKDVLEKFGEWVAEAKKRKILLYTHLTQGNHGREGGSAKNNSHYQPQIKAMAKQYAAWMKDNPNLYLTPVAEGGNCTASIPVDRALQEWCKANMPVGQLVNNWPSKPSNTDGMGHCAQHPGSVAAAKNARPGWIVSDHGNFIRELNGGGSLEAGNCDYRVTNACARELIKRYRTFIYFDTNTTRHRFSTTALRALKDAR